MPLFKYRAQDNQGRTVEGMVTADTPQAATQNLVARGFRIFDLAQKGDAATAPTAPRPVAPQQVPPPAKAGATPASSPPKASVTPGANFAATPARRAGSQGKQILLNAPAAPRPVARPAGPQRVNIPAPAPVNIVRTKRGSDKANMFLFTQLASFFRAGVNPADAFTTLSQNHPKPWYRESLADAAKATAEGMRFSQVLERYPDLYPPHIVGMIRAGEEGGFLVEATEAVAEQTTASMKFNVWPRLLFWWVLSNIIFLPPLISLSSALNHLTDEYMGPHQSQDPNGLGMLMNTFLRSTLWPVGPMSILITAVTWGVYAWWMKLENQVRRHRALLKVPTIGKRAKSESLATFAWVLSMVSRAGIAPRAAWNLATGAMPSLAMAERMRQAGNQMHDGTKLSEAISNAHVVPADYGSIVSNGELVGDVPSALMTISAASRDDYTREDGMSKMRIGCWGSLVIALAFLAGGLVFAHFYTHMIQVVPNGD